MTKDEALKLALEALENLLNQYYADTTTRDDLEKAEAAITAIREALADSALDRMAENARELGLDYEAAQQQEPVALPEKIYEFVPTPEPVKWHHPECEGQCIACLIEQVVQEAYGSQGLGYLQRHLTPPPQRKPLTDEEIAEIMVQIWFNNNIPVRERSHRLARAIEAAHGIKE